MSVQAQAFLRVGKRKEATEASDAGLTQGPHEAFACYGPYQVEHFCTLQVSSETDEAPTSRVPSVYLSHFPLVRIDI